MKARMKSQTSRRAFTLVEMMVSTVLIAIFLGLIIYVFQYGRRTQEMTDKLDALHDARLINARVSSELKFSTGVLYPVTPKTGVSQVFHQVIFRDPFNRVKAIILDPENQLLLLDYERLIENKLAPPAILGKNVESFDVTVNDQGLLQFRAKCRIAKVGKEVVDGSQEVMNQVLPNSRF